MIESYLDSIKCTIVHQNYIKILECEVFRLSSFFFLLLTQATWNFAAQERKIKIQVDPPGPARGEGPDTDSVLSARQDTKLNLTVSVNKEMHNASYFLTGNLNCSNRRALYSTNNISFCAAFKTLT